jgi:cell wall-associated NlpC family hydrolase
MSPLRALLPLLCCLWLAACSTQPARQQVALSDGSAIAALQAQYREWRGVRYRNGGVSKSGIDCSGLVHLTYRDLFGIDLPRSTGEQARLGTPVAARQWQAGDLVFFRINRWTNHVGIYLEQGKFLHASSSSGVMISHVDEPYWKNRYWKAARLSQPLVALRD